MAEEEYQEAAAGEMDAQYESIVSQNEDTATQALNAGRGPSAIPDVLSNSIIGCKNQALKDRNADVMMKLLTCVKEAGVKAIVDKLDEDQIDVLMKYVYRLLETGDNSPILLKWHECAFEKGGLGTIVRVISERRTV